MALTTETVTINGKDYKHIYSDVGYYIKRNDNKLFMDVLQPTASTYTYTETTQIATQNIIPRMMKRMSTIETNHAALANLPHVTETYSQGTDWYRIYSDKWCLQGRYTATSGTSQVVTLKKAYKDTNYDITYANFFEAVPSGTHLCNFGKKTTTTFTRFGSASWTGFFWQTSGYVK